MIEKIKASKSEKAILIFIVTLAIFFFGSFFLIKDKCLFVKNYDPQKINFNDKRNIAILNVTCGNVIIELYPDISPQSVKRFKELVRSEAYDNIACTDILFFRSTPSAASRWNAQRLIPGVRSREHQRRES